MTNVPDPAAGRDLVAECVGLRPEQLTDELLAQLSDDPLFLHHAVVCRGDADMQALLLAPYLSPAAGGSPRTNRQLLVRAAAAQVHLHR